MQVLISGQHIDIGSSLRKYMEDKTGEVILKYFDDVNRINIHLDKDGNNYKCDIEIHNAHGKNANLNSHGSAIDVQDSFDEALAKAEVQLRKFKSKSKDHNRSENAKNMV